MQGREGEGLAQKIGAVARVQESNNTREYNISGSSNSSNSSGSSSSSSSSSRSSSNNHSSSISITAESQLHQQHYLSIRDEKTERARGRKMSNIGEIE